MSTTRGSDDGTNMSGINGGYMGADSKFDD
jgi:hypothetical protein